MRMNHMRQNWIEFKKSETDNINLRPEYIIGISEFPFNYDENINEPTRILYEVGNSVQDILIYEPYEQVKQKIMDAERVDLSDVAIEHFTRDEYEILYKLIDLEAGHTVGTSEYIPIKRIRDELDKILEEYK